MATGVNLTTGEVIEDAFPAHLHTSATKSEWTAATVLSDDGQWLIGGAALRDTVRALIAAGVSHHYWHDDPTLAMRLREKTPQERAARRTDPGRIAATRATKLRQLRDQTVSTRFAEYAAARAATGSSEQAMEAVYSAHRTAQVRAEEARINAAADLDDLLSDGSDDPRPTVRERP